MNAIDYNGLSKKDLTSACEFLLEVLTESQEQSKQAIEVCNRLTEACHEKDEQIIELKSMIEEYITIKGF